MEPRLGHLLGLAPAPTGDREELFGAWRRYVERVADRGTTVLVFEDLHWADPGLLDFVESLLEWSPHLACARRRPRAARAARAPPDLGGGLRVTGLHLEPAARRRDRPAGDRLRARAPGRRARPPRQPVRGRAAVRRRDRADAGRPRRARAGGGGLPRRRRRRRTLDIPETLHALVAARLDGLARGRALPRQDAAVVGHRFTVAGLSR